MSLGVVLMILLFVGITFVVSYQSAIYIMKETSPTIFGTNVFVATMIQLLIVALATFCWFVYAWSISETLFLHGFYLGIELLIISEASLVLMLYQRRQQIEERLQSGQTTQVLFYLNRTKSFVKQKIVERKVG